jgi:hypothetical protein
MFAIATIVTDDETEFDADVLGPPALRGGDRGRYGFLRGTPRF